MSTERQQMLTKEPQMSTDRPPLGEAVASMHSPRAACVRMETGRGVIIGARRGGFALGLVVLLLFAIGVAGAVGFQVVQVESQLSNQAREMNLALSVAEAGLKRFLGESRDCVGKNRSLIW